MDSYIDFNAIAKGYAVDEIANFLKNNQIDNYLVDPKAIFSNMLSTKEIEDWGALNDIKGSNKNIKFRKLILKKND